MESAPKIEICAQMCDRETGAQQFTELVMSEIHCQRPRCYKFEFSFVENDRPPSQKSGMHLENRNTPDSPDLSLFTPDDRGYLLFRVFISRQNLGQSGNNKIPDHLGFSRHMKTRLQAPPCSLLLGWFSYRTGTSVDDGTRKSNNWLDQWQSRKLGTGSWAYVVLSARFPVVKWCSRSVAKSAY